MLVQPGFYLYIGSAFGPGGLGGRLSHHLSPVESPHWHIDYLRPVTSLAEVWVTEDRQKREHEWAQALAASREAIIPKPGFGASDCHCRAHLFFFPVRPTLEWFSVRIKMVLRRWVCVEMNP